MTEAAFLARVLEAPESDAPRLLFADWLEERGNDARAEFIRVQCALAGLDCHHPRGVKTPWCRVCVLRRREGELLDARGFAWLCRTLPFIREGALREGFVLRSSLRPHAFRAEWRRGFVGGVSCTLEAWMSHDRAVVRAAPIAEVTLTDKRPALSSEADAPGPAGCYGWWSSPTDRRLPPEFVGPEDLPRAVWDRLKGCRRFPRHRRNWRWYDTEAAALSALSAALLAWARA